MDVALAGIALIVASPILIIVSLWIVIDSPGGVLFRQERVGRHGVPFGILKLRTMHAGAESTGQVTTYGDARITRAGRILRAYRLDELPQLLNILIGDMSFVGPRPEVPKYVALYPREAREKVLSVRPGLTDPATIRFRDEVHILSRYADQEEAYRTVILPEKIRLYCEYVDTRTLLGDVVLLCRTIGLVLQSG